MAQQTCGNNMMAASKAQELGCSANDNSCLCKNPDFAYGFRDCAAAICSADEAKMLVEYVVKLCKGTSDLNELVSTPDLVLTVL